MVKTLKREDYWRKIHKTYAPFEVQGRRSPGDQGSLAKEPGKILKIIVFLEGIGYLPNYKANIKQLWAPKTLKT